MQQQANNIERDIQRGQDNTFKQPLNRQIIYKETRYRWIILSLAAMILFMNGLINNIIIPIQSTLSNTYDVSGKVVNIPSIISFLIFSLVNIPINHLLDKRGIRFGLLLGNSIYLVGIAICCLINAAFPFLIIGYLIFSFGQPFIVNVPAKIAAYWFLPENRNFATSILVGSNIIGSGLGFAIPALVVKQAQSIEVKKRQIFSLYIGYSIATLALLIINSLLLKAVPSIPASNIQNKQKMTIKQTFQTIKSNKNIWKFFLSYSIFYGSFQLFSSISNFIIKPFEYTDLEISLAAVCLIVFGSIGAVTASIYIKKTKNYKRLITFTTFAGSGIMVLMAAQLLVVPKAFLTIIIVGLLGFAIIPIIPNSYQIGCQLAFPIGEAQVTGILNGGSLAWAFVVDALVTVIIGFGDKVKSFIYFLLLIIALFSSSFLYYKTQFHQKRKQFELNLSRTSSSSHGREQQNKNPQAIQLAVTNFVQDRQETVSSDRNEQYGVLNQQIQK